MLSLMYVEAPHFCASAMFRQDEHGSWQCFKAAPILKYMVGMTPGKIKAYLQRKRWKYSFFKMKEQP